MVRPRPAPVLGLAAGFPAAGFEDVWEDVGVDSGSMVFEGDLGSRLVYSGPVEVDRCGVAVADGVVEDVVRARDRGTSPGAGSNHRAPQPAGVGTLATGHSA